MSWQLATFAGIGAVLVGGFAWYERARPPARLVALIAALAALAVAGRLVLAPIPNVVATTDIALFTGYALGAAPGFAVGALAAPISNIWLGQGPWTVWQMAGWGLVGLAGAALAAVAVRRLGRVGLALACATAGFAYGALLDLSVMVTYGGEQSLDRYLALSARGLPFNIAHAAGNFAIAFAAGPALVRMISRYRTRMSFTWKPAAALPLAILGLAVPLLSAHAPARAAAPATAPAWLVGERNSDGGFGAASSYSSNPEMTGWAALGLEAAGRNPLDLGARNPIAYLRSQAGRLRSAGDLERTVLALEGAGVDSRRFQGHDLVAELRALREADGSISRLPNLTAFYVLALRAAGIEPGELGRSVRWLRETQNRDGGWGFGRGTESDPDSTGAVLQALAAAGGDGRASTDGVRFLRRTQDRGGGWGLATEGVINAQSTAWAVQGMVATGARGEPLSRALAYLGSLRASDGHYRYSSASDQTPIWVTAQVLLAVRRQPFPLAPAPRQVAGSEREDAGGAREDTAGGGAERPPPRERSAGAPRHAIDSGARSQRARSDRGGLDPAAEGKAAAASNRLPGNPSLWGGTGPGVASAPPEVADTSSDTLAYALGGLGALALALAAGFLLYRRRLP